MRSRPGLRRALVLISAVLATACHTYSSRLLRVGTIASRSPRNVANTRVPAMFVIDDMAFARNPCGHATLFTIGSDTRVVNENGARMDTSALAVGRRVSVFVTDNTIILESCPPETFAEKVIVH